MAAVKQQVLNWLYSVLTSEYKDVNRTYTDVAQTLSHYSSLSPRTDVYTYENGKPALLLHISGTLPVVFRGTTYRFPVAIWVPHAYPMEPPLVYAAPTDGMMVRPGQHVDSQGKVYHPYLVGWAEFWDKSNILDFMAILREIFAKEPPVVSRQQTIPRPQPSQTPPPIPPPPPGRPTSIHSNTPDLSMRAGPPPPPPPPKTNSNFQQYSTAGPSGKDGGPPLPPLPPGHENSRYGQQGRPLSNEYLQRPSSLNYERSSPSPLPQRQQSSRDGSAGPLSPPRIHSYQQQYSSQNPNPLYSPQQARSPPIYNAQNQPQQQYQGQPFQWHQHYPQQPPPQLLAKPPPPPDLLDAPLVLDIPSEASTNLPAPPIPPNPEKDMLLHKLGQSLYSQRQHTRNQTSASLPGLEAQHKAMLTSLNSMQAEIQALESLSSLLSTNTKILRSALHGADEVIESSQHRTAPSVDELLVAPTVVANQLYGLVSEERSLGDALFILGRAVERGRITPAVFAKMTRSLAREWYLKKALVKKIGEGMGLETY